MSELSVLGSIRTANKYLYKKISDLLGKYNLTFSEFSSLDIVSKRNPITVQELAKMINLTSGTMTYTIDKLSKKGYLFRQKSTEDSRVYTLHLSEKGKLFHKEVSTYLDKEYKKILNDILSKKEMEQLSELLSTFIEGMRNI